MTIKVGDRLPNVSVRLVTPDGPKPTETKDYFAGKKVVLFGLPGAFTPTCHKNHLPGFIVGEAAFKAKGVDKIAMTAVNDHHVLNAWAEATGAKGHIDFLADGNGELAKALGLELDAVRRGPGLALEALFDAGRRRRRQGAQHRAGARQGGCLRRRPSFGPAPLRSSRLRADDACSVDAGREVKARHPAIAKSRPSAPRR